MYVLKEIFLLGIVKQQIEKNRRGQTLRIEIPCMKIINDKSYSKELLISLKIKIKQLKYDSNLVKK